MLLTVSLMMVLAYSIYFVISPRIKTYKQNSSLARCVPMVLGMTSSITIGLLITIWMSSQLAISTILSIIISAIIALMIGKDFGINGILEAQTSSLMGAMMGAMLGVMLSPNEITIMIVATDLLYIVSFYSMLIITTKASSKSQNFTIKNSAFLYLMLILNISLIGSLGVLQTIVTENPSVKTEKITHVHDH
ncbi:hypothetical protein [Peribacillus frigoritolerans]|uniref:hypothetical protein n=1 Tax=Peribacillus frigoritolerans TaxID=450367 RepID=UPI00315DFF55